MTWKLLLINGITLIRLIGTIILVPIYKYFGGLYVGIVSFICYLTDSIDGILARKWKVSTFFGAFFDGVADKLFTIMNFVVLYLITPHALIPIIFEIIIIFTSFLKFIMRLNIKSNVIGKLKVWILAVCVVITFLVSDINSMIFIPLQFREWLLNIPSNSLYFWLLLPAILIEILTVISYVIELFISKRIQNITNSKNELVIPKLKGKSLWEKFKCIWLNPEFYEEHKNDANLKALWKLSIR